MEAETPVLDAPVRRPPGEELRFKLRQLAGKLRRYFRSNIYTLDNEQLLEQRKGECTRCGGCCKILVRCPFLEEIEGEYNCSIYGEHFAQCRIFPLVPKDLKEIEEPCGYYFESD